jgi:phage head maturation protease
MAGGQVTNPGGTEKLHEYWVHGPGAAKIRWGQPGDFDRCVTHLGKFIADPKGYCAKAHHDALGIWPATHAAMEHKAGRADMAKHGTDVTDRPAASRALVEIRRDCQLEDIHIVRTAEGDSSGRVVEAYASVFDQPVEIRDHQGHYTEIIDRASFNDVLAHIRRSRGGLPAAVKVLYNHGKTMEGDPAPEFQKPLGKPLFVEPESRGLLTRTEYSKTALSEEVLELVRDGAITNQSFVGAITRSDPELRGPGDKHRGRNGVLPVVRRMVLGLREYGPVLWAAYSGAEILGVRMQLPGDAGPSDFDVPLDEESGPDEEAADAGSVPEDTTTARYHQHALFVLRAVEMREKAGLVF